MYPLPRSWLVNLNSPNRTESVTLRHANQFTLDELRLSSGYRATDIISEAEVRKHTLSLVTDYQTLLAQKKLDEWIELWADNGILEFPYAPAGRKSCYRGKTEIFEYMTKALGRVVIDGIERSRLYSMEDPQIAVAEVAVKGHALATGAAYNRRYVTFIETRNGKIAHYREYWNPLITIDAYGGRDVWTSGFGSRESGN